ncbi:unnamed protein product [Prorocentrum cordatum]|uniref:AP2/ERF domain-containing protein n=1 Tax=Prorocentrum cordatum TaxID=2364126 RepID=A0ABN9WW04_9DINO|nr:unnamed protein product [Polarella glacialis]
MLRAHFLKRMCTAVATRGAHPYRGVSYDKGATKWRARVAYDRKIYRLGSFGCCIEAACAYDEFLRKCDASKYSVLRRLNFPTLEEEDMVLNFSYEDRRRENIARYAGNYMMQATAQQIIEAHVSTALECEWMCEGTLADGIVRPSLCSDDAWIGIQIKSTAEPWNGSYRFAGAKKYAGLLMLCVGLDQELLWLIPGCDVNVECLSISVGGKWDAYRCPWHDLSSELQCAWGNPDVYKRYPAELWKTPRSARHQDEQRARKLGENVLRAAGLTITTPSVAYGPVDIIINRRIRVQTKSRSKENSSVFAYQIPLARKAGRGVTRPYSADEFDVLVVYLLRDGSLGGMFVIPVIELALRGYVASSMCDRKPCTSLCVYPPWSSPTLGKAVVAKAWQAKYSNGFLSNIFCAGQRTAAELAAIV